jgi:hypothetical protein
LAAPVRAERTALEQRDGGGRVVLDVRGARLEYGTSESTSRPLRGDADPPDTTESALRANPGPAAARLVWYRAAFGSGIGAAGLAVGDIDADGDQDLVAAASAEGFLPNSYWYVIHPEDGRFEQRWTSIPFQTAIERTIVAQIDQDDPLEVLVASGGNLYIIDGRSHEIESSFVLPGEWVRELAVAQLDGDPAPELVHCDASDLWVHDLSTTELQLHRPGFGGYAMGVGEVDGSPGLEIVVGSASDGWMLDGETGEVEWDHPLGFGERLALGDLDGDGLDEIAAGFTWSGIQVWNGDTHAFAWEEPVFNLGAILAGDVDGDGAIELLYGDAQWGEVHVLEGATGDERWSVANPEHGVTRIAVGDLTGDGAPELFFGSGYTSTGPDRLHAVDGTNGTVRWQSTDISGPFTGLENADVDADGVLELVYTSASSDSNYGDGLYFVHDSRTRRLEYQSPEPTGLNWTGMHALAVGNADSDPALEIFVPTGRSYTGVLQCRDGVDGGLQWEASLVSGLTFGALRVADVDGDGSLEVASGSVIRHSGAPGLYVQLHSAESGAPLWQSFDLRTILGGAGSLDLLRVADVDQDGRGELLVAPRGAGLLAIDPVTGTIDLDATQLDVTALELLSGIDAPFSIVVGTTGGEILAIDPASGEPTTLAGPFQSAIDGLAAVDLFGDPSPDFVFASGDRLYLVDGGTLGVEWVSPDLGTAVGRSDSLRVGDLDADGDQEIWVNAGLIGHMIFALEYLPFADGFEAADFSAWSKTQTR